MKKQIMTLLAVLLTFTTAIALTTLPGLNAFTYYTATFVVSPEGAGTVNPVSARVLAGTETSNITATANAGFSFEGWYAGETLLSTENPHKFTLTSDITITAKVMRAIEKWLDPAKAVWEDEGNNTATLTIGTTESYPVPIKGGEITLTLKRKEAPASIQLTIEPDDYKIATFNHWKTKTQENSLEVVKDYKYTSAHNINLTTCTKEEGNIYKPAYAAKMILYINAGEGYKAPENWTSYTWNVNNDDKD